MRTSRTPETPDHLEGLLATLMAAIFGMTKALLPVIETIAHTPTRPWIERNRLSGRFWAIIRQLLALTPRITLRSISETPAYPPLPPRAPRPGRARAPRLRVPHAILSPRQLARRLAALLHQLICLAAEAKVALTPEIHRLSARLRTIAGCNALPRQTWESTA